MESGFADEEDEMYTLTAVNARPDYDFTNAELISASFADTLLEKPTWHALMLTSVSEKLKHCGSYAELRLASRAYLRSGRYKTPSNPSAWHYCEDMDISILHVNASRCWSFAAMVARSLGASVKVTVAWKHPSARNGEIESFILDIA